MWATVLLCLAGGPVVAGPQGLSDETTKSRLWTDNTAKFTVTAALAEIKDNSVFLEKEDRTVIQVPLNRLSRKDAHYVNELIGLARFADFLQAANELLAAVNEGDTSAKREVLARENAAEFCRKFDGKIMTVRYRIVDITQSSEGRSSVFYKLDLDPIVRVPAPYRTWWISSYTTEMTEKEMLAIGTESRLWVTGLAKLEYKRDRNLGAMIRIGFHYSLDTAVHLYLKRQKVRIEHEPEREEQPEIRLDSPLP